MATIPEALSLAIRHHQAGRLNAAEQIYRQILTFQPSQPDALHLLGVIASQVGKHDLAIEHIRRAIELKGDVAAFHSNLGEAYRGTQRLSEAIACYRRALELKPDYAEAHNNLGVAYRDQGNPTEAVACYRRALELKPDYAEAHSNLGAALMEQRKLPEAVACCRRALELRPGYAQAHNNLGAALMEQRKLHEAVACWQRALELKPDYAEAFNNLAIALKEQERLDEALACCRRALELKPGYAGAHNTLGNVLQEQGKPDEAIACFRRALEFKPDYAEAHANLGNAFEELGDLAGAEDGYRAALHDNPRFAAAHYKLAVLLRGRLPQQDLSAQRHLLEEGELADTQRLMLHFGLAQVLDARGAYAEAAEHLDRGNAMQLSEWRQRGQGYDLSEYERIVGRMIAACGPEFFERVGGFGLESELPVFVVGLPRSGTTLVEQILASHSQVFGAGEIKLASDTMAALGGQGGDFTEGLRQLDRPTAQRLALRHLERLRAIDPAAQRIVDKVPDNYLLLGLLASLFPRAKFIHCRRDPRDVAVSCWITHFRQLRWANDQQHIASRFHQYRRVMEHWRTVLPVPLLEVDYEETVDDLEGTARRLVARCGLEWEPACLEFHRAKRSVATASAVQVRQPVFKTSAGRWKHYEQSLATLLGAIPASSE